MKKTVLSGIQATGEPHIGNYFGAIKQFVALQDDYEGLFFVANYHSLTGTITPEALSKNALSVVVAYLALGIDPKKSKIFLQSDVPEVTELTWIFNTITTMPYLERAHAFKSAEAKASEINVGLFDYPILMSADILIHDADLVPVGQDQKQHLEIARDVGEKFNRLFGNTFKIPEPLILEEVKTIPGTDGRKMSKSYGNTISLFASDDEIKQAVMSIPTDSKGTNEPKDPNTCNVFAIHRLLSTSEIDELEKRYQEGTIGYKESKEILIKNIQSFIAPLREKRRELEADPEKIKVILKEGADFARTRAQEKMRIVKEKLGLTVKL